jgi:hypothetical protein
MTAAHSDELTLRFEESDDETRREQKCEMKR